MLAGRGEGGAGDLLGVEAVGADEGVVLAAGESSGNRLRRKVVTESRVVGQLVREGRPRAGGVGFLSRHYWLVKDSRGRGRDVWDQ